TDAAAAPALSRGRKLDVVIVVGLLAALALTFLWRRESIDAAPPMADASGAVLAFVPIGTDPSLKPLGEGLAEQVTKEPARGRDVRGASRTSAFEQGGKDAIAIAKALGVSYVLEGSVRPADQRVRVTAQLIRGADGVHVMSETYDVRADQNAELDQIANIVAFMVVSSMGTQAMLQAGRAQTQNDDAFEHFAAAVRLRSALQVGRTAEPRPMQQVLAD